MLSGLFLRVCVKDAEHKLQQTPVQVQTVLKPIRDAVAGLDGALAQFAEASKLALEEAAGRAQKFSNDELVRVRKDLEGVENLFLETLQSSASTAHKVVGETLHDLATHARRNGTAVGSQLEGYPRCFNQQMASVGHDQLEAGIELTHAITSLCGKLLPMPSAVLLSVLSRTTSQKEINAGSGDQAALAALSPACCHMALLGVDF